MGLPGRDKGGALRGKKRTGMMQQLIMIPLVCVFGIVLTYVTYVLVHLYDRLQGHCFDLTHGVDTGGRIHLCKLDILSDNQGNGHCYQPTPARTVRSILRALKSELEGFTFVDFGSGKGRVLLTASEFPLDKIVGVEFSRKLCTIARENIRRFGADRRTCADVESQCVDAADFEIPDDNCILYFFNPFDRDLMGRICANIERSYRRRPRKLFVVLYHPRNLDMFAGLSFLKARRLAGANTDFFQVFETVAEPVHPAQPGDTPRVVPLRLAADATAPHPDVAARRGVPMAAAE